MPTDEAGALLLLAAAKKKGGPSDGVALFHVCGKDCAVAYPVKAWIRSGQARLVLPMFLRAARLLEPTDFEHRAFEVEDRTL
ncbi:hypothetical protein [Sphingomonas sp. R86520]|uniref:hypothetical protein n=1 Tax=Sphingomonas sp. R86520 TaxID=3093859 RepID=UPI0036D37140